MWATDIVAHIALTRGFGVTTRGHARSRVRALGWTALVTAALVAVGGVSAAQAATSTDAAATTAGSSIGTDTPAQSAQFAQFAPLDQSAPPLTTPLAQLQGSLTCSAGLADAKTEPVLLIPATGVDSASNFSWSWEPFLTAHGIPWCASDQPGAAATNMTDMVNRVDYLVYAIRYMYAVSGRKIGMIGASQGGMIERWPLRFFPDTRSMVDDVISLDGDNHGTLDGNLICTLSLCAPSFWQQAIGSNFVTALNSYQETFPGISYTDISTDTDDIVLPNLPGIATTTPLSGPGDISNISIQQICPLMVAEHLMLASSNPVAAELALDALTHAGPGQASAVPASTCAMAPDAMPGIPFLTTQAGAASVIAGFAIATATAPLVSAEPALPSYVYAK